MNLEQSILNALDFTRRLQAALKLGDMELCAEILALRGEAMALFEHLHRHASEQDRQVVQPLVQELAQADRQLQEESSAQLTATASEFRSNLNSGPARSNQTYSTGPTQACVDIKA